MGWMDYLGQGANLLLDYADKAVGVLGEAGDWMQKSPGAATLLGSALVAGGSYFENREALKEQRKQRDEEWNRQDTVMGVADMPAVQLTVTPGLTGNRMTDGGVLANGVLANIQKNNKGGS
ncbi:hypothetical protein [Aeromonas caviae]|uniref:hypothetical protein n=1 Tax=Aeromonas caviae TaxID=648 RepID=UPI003F7477D6